MSIKYTERLAEAAIEPSVGRVGYSYNNALAETINVFTKLRRSGEDRGDPLNLSNTPRSTGWTGSNNRRLLAPIGNIPPAEAEERYHAMLDDNPMAA